MELVASSTAILVAAICMIIVYTWRSSDNKKKIRYPPYVSTVFHMLINFDRALDFLTEHAHKHKTFRIFAVSKDLVYTTDPANVEYILKTNFSNYGKGEVLREQFSDLLGDGIFTVDGEKWRHQRKLASFEFSTKNIRDFSTTVFKDNAVKFAHMISESAILNQANDYQDLFMKSTLDSVFRVVLGVELDTICGTFEDGIKFSNAFDKASQLISLRPLDVFWKIKKFLNIKSEALLKNNVKLVDDYVYKIINCKISKSSPEDTSIVKKGDVLSRFLEANERDPKYLKDIILSFIIAGKDTTATTLSWFLYMLCKHPDVQEKISNEVREATKVRGNDFSYKDLATSLTEEAIDKLHYLHATLTETLRLYPAVPVDPKTCFSDDTLPDGLNVKKGDQVFYMPYAIGRMKYIWGDDAEEFKPQRWLNEDGNFTTQSSFKFTAFQAGPRICLGKEFAYRQMKIFSAILVGSFKFRLSDEHKVATYKTMLTLNMNMNSGLHIHASQRRSQ